MTPATWYEDIADVYEKTYGEPLVAGREWVEPIFDMCETAVCLGVDMGLDEFVGGAQHDEVVQRTAAVIAVATHGVGVVSS